MSVVFLDCRGGNEGSLRRHWRAGWISLAFGRHEICFSWSKDDLGLGIVLGNITGCKPYAERYRNLRIQALFFCLDFSVNLRAVAI